MLDGSGSSDPDTDPLTYAWDVDNDGQYDDAVGETPTVTWAALVALGLDDDGGPFTVGLEVDDGNGGVTTDTSTITITNTGPALTLTGAATTAHNTSYTVTLGATDPGADTITSWTIDWGDGTVDPIAGNPASASHTYTTPGRNHEIRAVATDEDGTHLAGNLVVPQWDSDRAIELSGTTGDAVLTYDTDPTVDGAPDAVIGPDGLLYVASYLGGDVVRFDPTTGAFVDVFIAAGTGGLDGPGWLEFRDDGELWVASWVDASIKRYDASTGASLGDVVVAGLGGLAGPSEMTVGPDGNLYVSAWGTSAVHRYNPTTGAFIDLFANTNLTSRPTSSSAPTATSTSPTTATVPSSASTAPPAPTSPTWSRSAAPTASPSASTA